MREIAGYDKYVVFLVIPFWLCNAMVIFQQLMQNTLDELSLTYCIIYLDDMIVFGRMEEKHLECSFFQPEIVYLVHHVSHEEIHPSQENVHTIEEFPMPETFTQVCMFCRLAGHYWCFIKGFANIARPPYDVLGKEVKMGPVQLPPEAWEAVRILKDKIQSTPMLVFPDFDIPFLLETNVSKNGLGVVLSQKQDNGHYHPVAFGICSLMPSERNYHSS